MTGTSSTLMPAVGSSNMKNSRLEREQDRDFELALIAVRQRGRRADRDARVRPTWREHVVGLLDQLGDARARCDEIEADAAAGFAPQAAHFRAR